MFPKRIRIPLEFTQTSDDILQKVGCKFGIQRFYFIFVSQEKKMLPKNLNDLHIIML